MLGWKAHLGNLRNIIEDAVIFGGEYKNRSGLLTSKQGRIWYEADINYIGGFRNESRLLFLNDGLLFVSYDHYRTFYEIIS